MSSLNPSLPAAAIIAEDRRTPVTSPPGSPHIIPPYVIWGSPPPMHPLPLIYGSQPPPSPCLCNIPPFVPRKRRDPLTTDPLTTSAGTHYAITEPCLTCHTLTRTPTQALILTGYQAANRGLLHCLCHTSTTTGVPTPLLHLITILRIAYLCLVQYCQVGVGAYCWCDLDGFI